MFARRLQRGDQVAYVPPHAQKRTDAPKHWRTWDPAHPDVEFGFVTSQNEQFVFCRFWLPGQPGVLRTTANSEGAPRNCLVKHISVEQDVIDAALEQIEKAQP